MTTVVDTPVLDLTGHPAWVQIKAAASALQELQAANGAIEDAADHPRARDLVGTLVDGIAELSPHFPHDAAYLFDRFVQLMADHAPGHTGSDSTTPGKDGA